MTPEANLQPVANIEVLKEKKVDYDDAVLMINSEEYLFVLF